MALVDSLDLHCPVGNNRLGLTPFTDGAASQHFLRGSSPVIIPPGDPIWSTTGYYYEDPAHAHAVTRLSNGAGFEYDANGNMTERFENGQSYIQTFNSENRLTQVVAGGTQTSTYVYDAEGAMVKRVRPDGTATVYVGMVEYELNQTGTVTATTSYYAVPGARVVRNGSGVFWVLTDHLGSSSVTVDASGNNVVGEVRYEAYGATRVSTGTTPTDKLFTGQRAESTGLYFYNARWYDPAVARFVSADTVVPDPINPQLLNRYAYSFSNPLKYTDPTGHSPRPSIPTPQGQGILIGLYLLFNQPLYPYLTQIPAYFGYGANPLGVDVANQHRAIIEASASGAVDPIALAAGIAVQSPGNSLVKDNLLGSSSNSRGIAQITSGETAYFPSGTAYDPYNGEWSVQALNNKMNAAANVCGAGCSSTDRYLFLAMGQNSLPSSPPTTSNGQFDWNAYFSTAPASPDRIDVAIRSAVANVNNWQQFQLRAFLNALRTLLDQGWQLPADVDLDYMQCLADNPGSCSP